jgi:threonine/homoserine/homoserine lactone efflux protein
MLPPDTLAALVSFAFVASITPGPNNIMLTASGVNFGFARTIPHMLGIGVGFMALLGAVGMGIATVFRIAPQLDIVLKVVGTLYMLWLAWKVATATAIAETGGQVGRPMTFWQAVAFQWVNPKGWVMAVSAMALYVRPSNLVADVAAVTLVFGVVNLPSVATWAAFGHALRNVLRDPSRIRIFNIAMGLLLAASVLPIVFAR